MYFDRLYMLFQFQMDIFLNLLMLNLREKKTLNYIHVDSTDWYKVFYFHVVGESPPIFVYSLKNIYILF